ncbi:MAG TPA: metalloregulator ArsR/SmtB family transcription factor [Acidimicrobiales bacterium]|nr:metalloregulator ArsR/SmtB family transcription factor [Acidimicrobiales bacterium]
MSKRSTDVNTTAAAFAALGDPVRLEIYRCIAESDGSCCSCDLEAPVGKSQPTISHHTKVLAEAGLIEGERQGRWVYWRVVPGALAKLKGALPE